MTPVNVKVKRMRTRGATGALKAFFTVSLGPVDVEDMRLLENRDGELFIGFPSKKITKSDGTTSWFEIVRLSKDGEGNLSPTAKEAKETILKLATEEYQRRMREPVTTTATGGVDDDLPF
jgi:DNA-binding cell septation regulator SpoVG